MRRIVIPALAKGGLYGSYEAGVFETFVEAGSVHNADPGTVLKGDMGILDGGRTPYLRRTAISAPGHGQRSYLAGPHVAGVQSWQDCDRGGKIT